MRARVMRSGVMRSGVMGSTVIRNVAFFGMAGFAIFGVVFIVSEYFAEPGGVEAVVGVLGLLLTIGGVSIWAWLSPRTAQYYLWASVGVIFAVSIWWALAPRIVFDFMDEQEPMLPVVAIIAAVPLAVWGRRDWTFTVRAGIALLIVAWAPLLGVAASPLDVERGVLGAVALMTIPYAAGGALYALAVWLRNLPELRHRIPDATMHNTDK